MTPRIIRIPDVRQEDLEALWIGNESNPRLRGDAGSVFATPFTAYLEEPEEDDEEGLEAAAEVEPASETAQPAPAAAGAPSAGPAAARDAVARPAGPPAVEVQPRPAMPPVPEGEEPEGATTDEGAAEEDEDDAAADEAEPPAAPRAAPGGEIPNQALPPATGMNMTIAPARLTVVAGNTFALNLLVNNVVDLQKITFTMLYDPTTLDFDSGLEGIIMRQDGTQTLFSANKTADGQATVELSRLGGTAGVSRGGALAALRFRALAPGRSPITFGAIQAEGFDGSAIQVNASEAEITVSN